MVISAIRQNDRSGADQVHVFSGRTGRPIVSFRGTGPGTRFGASVARYDIEGTRRPALAIGESMGGSGASGAVNFWTIGGRPMTTVHGPGSFSAFGGLVTTTDDSDGDGRPELYVASPRRGREGSVVRIDSSSLPFAR